MHFPLYIGFKQIVKKKKEGVVIIMSVSFSVKNVHSDEEALNQCLMSECFHLMHFEHEWIDMPSTAWQYGLMLEIQLPNYRKINSIFVFGPENFPKPWKIFWLSPNLIIPYSKEGFVFDVPNEQWPCLN